MYVYERMRTHIEPSALKASAVGRSAILTTDELRFNVLQDHGI